MLGFRIWYADGSVVIGTTLAHWKQAPPTGVVQVFKYGESEAGPYRARYKGDWYFWQDDDLHVVSSPDDWGMWAPRPDISCEGCVKQSSVRLPDEEYGRIVAAAEAATWPP